MKAMNENPIKKILSRLGINDTGIYDNHFYIIDIENSDDYAKMYTKLSKNAIDTEFPTFGTNTNNSTVKITNYFELEEDNQTYNLFLIADFDRDKYYLKIGGFNN
jgi:hypothetical protein